MPQTPSTRWCPTPEQLMILEEMYRSGVRTPNASQIQQITAHLSLYGRIEGKNGCLQEVLTQGMNLVGKLEAGEGQEEEPAASDAVYTQPWMTMMDGSAAVPPPCCRPLKTLDLFPTKSTGMKDECSSSKSSSCSTSTN
ncbi:hypothetical protein C4D60_Mb02t16720 [Musa balbisiana]|uniref:Homeobox domain-containing protein n=1 Tax=Musa balbisiana TaxID=52838 RepID=A0A4S8IB73_MUSBA|nr:hypothetical protein C4D60_Mb02t16720 [Musa balbisiana]